MSNLVVQALQLPTLNLGSDLLSKIQANFKQASVNMSSDGFLRMTFKGRSFNIPFGGAMVELPDRVMDFYLVALNTQHHYTFYENAYQDGANTSDGRILSRYPVDSDPIIFEETPEFKSRRYSHRAVIMRADDPEHNLYIVDFGYSTCHKSGDSNLGTMNLSQLSKYMQSMTTQQQGFVPFMIKLQMSFTSNSVPEQQFSLWDNRPGFSDGSRTIRTIDEVSMNKIIEAYQSGVIDKMLKIEFDSAEFDNDSKDEPVPQLTTATGVPPQLQAKVQPAPEVQPAPQAVAPQPVSGLASL